MQPPQDICKNSQVGILALLPHMLVWFSALNCQAQCCWFDVECGVKTVTHHHTAE